MNTKIQDKKSNARIAWEEFISNFSLNDKKIPPSSRQEMERRFIPRRKQLSGTPTKNRHSISGNTMNRKSFPLPGLFLPRTTVIGEQVDITGNCKIEGDVEIYGEITGDVQAGGTIVVFGKSHREHERQKRDIECWPRVKGSIIAEETIELDDQFGGD